jgi:hypothetical protein
VGNGEGPDPCGPGLTFGVLAGTRTRRIHASDTIAANRVEWLKSLGGFMRCFWQLVVLAISAIGGLAQTPPPVLTYHNDVSRTGLNNNESILTLSNVNVNSFGKLFSYTVDGYIYAQPLYVPRLTINGVVHNVVFLATENNSVYAFDADNAGTGGGLLWQANFNTGPAGVTVTPVPSSDVSCSDLVPVIGITSTPVIDPTSQTIYVEARTKEVSSTATNYYHRLHALSILTGQEKFGGPVAIQATVAGSCGNTDGQGHIIFNPLVQHQRAALLLSNGTVYLGFASLCDLGPYNGWLFAYDAQTLAQTSVYNISPDGETDDCRGGIWQSGAGPAADASGYIYANTGNGTFNVTMGGLSYGDSMLKFAPGGASIVDYFTPNSQMRMDELDLDLGAGGPLLLPDQAGPYPHLAVAAGKTGVIYLVNRDSMGDYHRLSNQIVQQITNTGPSQPYPSPAYVNQAVYFAAAANHVKGYSLSDGQLSKSPFATASATLGVNGAGLSASTNSSGGNAIIWALEYQSTAILHAFNAANMTELYNSNQAGTRDTPGPGVKFAVPTVSNGKVYVGTANALAVYGNF